MKNQITAGTHFLGKGRVRARENEQFFFCFQFDWCNHDHLKYQAYVLHRVRYNHCVGVPSRCQTLHMLQSKISEDSHSDWFLTRVHQFLKSTYKGPGPNKLGGDTSKKKGETQRPWCNVLASHNISGMRLQFLNTDNLGKMSQKTSQKDSNPEKLTFSACVNNNA